MKQGNPLSEVLTEIKRRNEIKRDYIAPAHALRLEKNGKELTFAYMTFSTTDLFHRQLGSTLGIPAKYYDQMHKMKPALLADNVNAWLGDKTQSYMIRSYDGNECKIARALLSDRYKRIDNMEIAEAVLPLFASEGMEVISSALTDEHLYLKIVNRRLEAEVVPGDIVQAGVVVSNSEVGLGAVSVYPLVYRLVCSNGMCVTDFGERRTHIGRANLSEDFRVYSDETLEAEEKAFFLKLRDATMVAIEEVRFTRIVGKLQESANTQLTGRVQDVVELIGRDYSLNQNEQDGILDYLIKGGDLSLYGLANAITRTSQDVESYERATTLEAIGWRVVTGEDM